MSGDTKPRSVLSELKRPLLSQPQTVSQTLEERLLGPMAAAPALEPPPAATPEPLTVKETPKEAPKKAKEPTVPVTFHLPVKLRDRIKVTAQAQQRTMLEIAVEALEGYLDHHPVTETDLRRLLGL